jgi:hypothetical protein
MSDSMEQRERRRRELHAAHQRRYAATLKGAARSRENQRKRREKLRETVEIEDDAQPTRTI